GRPRRTRCRRLSALLGRARPSPPAPGAPGPGRPGARPGDRPERGRRCPEKSDGMILKLTPTSAQLVGENAREWQTLEKCVRLGQWTSGPRRDESRLGQVAAELRGQVNVRHVPARTRNRAW